MRRLIRFVKPMAVAGAMALGAVACNSTTNPLTAATGTTTATTITDTFSGTVNLNGAITHQLTVTGAGSVAATLTTVGPNAAVTVGFSLGVWNGSGCVITIANDNAAQGTSLTGTAGAAGTYCVRMYDAQGTFVTPVTYTVTVVHP